MLSCSLNPKFIYYISKFFWIININLMLGITNDTKFSS